VAESIPTKPTPRQITVVEGVYHMGVDVPTSGVDNRFSRQVESDEQPYSRRYTIGDNWTNLDFGWIERPGMLVISNEEGKFLQRNPTDEEKKDIAGRIVEIAGTPPWLILPGESFRGVPAATPVQVICRKGSAKIVVTVMPW